MIQFDDHIFQMGWFNHQLDKSFLWNLIHRGEVPNLEAGSDPVHQDGCWELFPTSSNNQWPFWWFGDFVSNSKPLFLGTFGASNVWNTFFCWKLMGFYRRSVCHGSFAEMCGQSDNFCLTASFQLLILLFRSDVFSKQIWIVLSRVSYLITLLNPAKKSKAQSKNPKPYINPKVCKLHPI